MIEEGGDWDRRNRLKVYEGAYLMTIRNFKGAADLFIATLSTFTSTELMEYKDFVTYAVLSSVLALKRVDIKNKVRGSRGHTEAEVSFRNVFTQRSLHLQPISLGH